MDFNEIIEAIGKPYFRDESADIAIYCGDNRLILPLIPDKSIDLVVTSPPYDDLREYGGNEWDFQDTAKGLFNSLSIGGVIVWVVGDATVDGSETGTSFRQALQFMEVGFNLHDTMIYLKRGFANPSNNRYHQVFEYMFVFSRCQPKVFNPLKDRRNIEVRGGGDATRQRDGSMQYGNKGGLALEKYGQRYNIWEYTIGGGNISDSKIVHQHPAAFPEALASDHIISWSNPNDLILDPFLGSGTTAVVAKKLNRKCIGIEISEEYCALAVKRLSQSVMPL